MMASEPVVFNPFDPVWRGDPYPYFQRLRNEAPVGQVPGLPIWYVARFADCEAVLRDRRVGVDTRKSPLFQMLAESSGVRLPGDLERRRSFLMLDPPDHTRLRGLVAAAFTPRMMQRLRPRIQEILNETLDDCAGAGRVDLIEDLARPVPFAVICELLGVPVEDRQLFRSWSKVMAGTLDPRLDAPPEEREDQIRVMRENVRYFEALIAESRRHPRENLLQTLIEVQDGSDRLSGEELVATLILLVAAGHETVVNLVGNAVYALLRHPDQLRLLRSQPDLVPNAVEEVLRWEPPVQLTQRIALEDLALSDELVPAGSPIALVLAAANRDEALFADGEQFDVGRPEVHHLTFVAGPHYCLGAPLARLEGEMMLRSLINRFPGLRLADQGGAFWRDSIVMRGLERLPVDGLEAGRVGTKGGLA